MKKLKVGIVGVGYFGRFHVMNLRDSPYCDVTGIHDLDTRRAEAVAHEFGISFFPSLEALLQQINAVFIAVPTSAHLTVAGESLKRGIHTFLEKPIAKTTEEAGGLVRLAETGSVKFQVGHIERFNPPFNVFMKRNSMKFNTITATRLFPYNPRGTDVSVIHDLMLHDIDLVLNLVNAPVKSIQAKGETRKSDAFDICNASIEFENGCRAVLTASRVADERRREIKMETDKGYCMLDLDKCRIIVSGLHLPMSEEDGFIQEKESKPEKDTEYFGYSKASPNILKTELDSFLMSVKDNLPVQVTGRDGLEALEMADKIMERCL
jgi:predicted dehydrogenase